MIIRKVDEKSKSGFKIRMFSQKTFLSSPVRFTIMIFLIASFFIISPLIILYTIGYRYDIRTGIVRETGVLSIDVQTEIMLACFLIRLR